MPRIGRARLPTAGQIPRMTAPAQVIGFGSLIKAAGTMCHVSEAYQNKKDTEKKKTATTWVLMTTIIQNVNLFNK